LFLPALNAGAQTMPYNFRHLTPNEGLSNDAARGIAQDQYGFIWIGTNFGLNRFDGTHVKTYYNQPGDSTSLANNFIRSLFADRAGNIWAGGDPGFCRYDYQRDQFIRYSGADCNIRSMTQSPMA
jgi:ligand-binding sensor domain-containing protein